MVHKLKLLFETTARGEDGGALTISRNFSASLHPKAALCDFIGKWRGRPVADGETIDFAKLIGANATLVISHQTNKSGGTYAQIDAVSKPTQGLRASGGYDPVAMRRRLAEWIAKQGLAGGQQAPVNSNQSPVISNQTGGTLSPALCPQAGAGEAVRQPWPQDRLFPGLPAATAGAVPLAAGPPVVGPAPATAMPTPAVAAVADPAALGDDDVPF